METVSESNMEVFDQPVHTGFFKKWGSLIVLSLALAIIVIDNTLLNVSFAAIIKDLHADILSMQWVITAYALMLSAFTITGGRLGDLFGRKKMFMLGAVIFAIGSIIASLSTHVSTLIWGEAIVEGIGAVLMLPSTSSLLVSNFKGRDRAVAFGVWGGIAAAASAVGPILGGYLTTNYTWRWGFRINVVVVLLLLAGSFLIKESKDEKAGGRIDMVGIILSSYGLFALVFGIIESSRFGFFHAKEIFSIAGHSFPLQGDISISVPAVIIGLVTLTAFFIWENWIEKRGEKPLVSLGLLKNRQFIVAASTTAFVFMEFSGIIFALPIFLQSVRRLDAFHTGLALLSMSLSLLFAAPFSAYFSKRISPKRIIQAGIVIDLFAFTLLYATLNIDSTSFSLSPGLIVFGLGTGLIMAQVNNVALSAVSVREAGEASGVNNTIRQLGQTLGTAIIGAVLLSTLTQSLQSGITASSVLPDEIKPSLTKMVLAQTSAIEFGQNTHFAGNAPQSVTDEVVNISQHATVDANKAVLLYGFLFALWGFIVSFSLPKVMKVEEH